MEETSPTNEPPLLQKHSVIRSFSLSAKNCEKVNLLFHFCNLYIAHRDFDLAKRIAKNSPMKWDKASCLSSFCNQIITTKESSPCDFMSDDNTNANDAIGKYLELKKCIAQVKIAFGTKNKDKLYKSVKSFYRKKMYCYQMDTFFTWLVKGLFMYINDFISFDYFKKCYCFEISLITGKKKEIDIRQSIKISQYIIKCAGF